MNIDLSRSHEPLAEYPWSNEVDRLLAWATKQEIHFRSFCFDVIMSLAYIDATSGLERNIQHCSNVPSPYNAHLGFINLCSPCYEFAQKWSYQKAAKPQSGALGKLSSEIILRFVQQLSGNLDAVLVIGGTESADALLIHNGGIRILAEVKSSPLVTYPVLFNIGESQSPQLHTKAVLTASQLRRCQSALYLHNQQFISLGSVGEDLWPFKQAVDFLVNPRNFAQVSIFVKTWLSAREAYKNRDKSNPMYYLANASGNPPMIAKDRDNWPRKESISDSKTSAGMDRTDDIKKGIYQVLKLGTQIKNDIEYKTAIISNLPAYRHGPDYVDPFVGMLWGLEADIKITGENKSISFSELRRVFDFIITIEEPVLRGLEL